MPITHVSGATSYSTTSLFTLTTTVTSGNTLVLSIGFYKGVADGSVCPSIIDDQGNIYVPVAFSPYQQVLPSGGAGFGLATFVVLNCVGGTITLSLGSYFGARIAMVTVDEYAGVAEAKAIMYDPLKITFASTQWGSGAVGIDSGPVTTIAGEMMYSACCTDIGAATIASTSGFTAREVETQSLGAPYQGTLASFDQLAPSPGTYHSVFTVSGSPDTIHAVLIVLSPVSVNSNKLVQVNCNSVSSISPPSTYVCDYLFSNTLGNVLIVAARIHGTTGYVISDTQGNAWVTVFNATGDHIGFVFGYALNCAHGANQVILTPSGGGDDDAASIIVAEYNLPGAQFTTSSATPYIGTPVTTINTGTIVTGLAVPQLLISMMMGETIDAGSCEGPVAGTPGLRRFQISDGGTSQEYLATVVLSDQLETVPGSYSDTFNFDVPIGTVSAAIIGFVLPIPVTLPTRCVNVKPSKLMPTLEVTRDMDADWDDSSTFIITQDDPLPFTLRGLVMRMSYNPD